MITNIVITVLSGILLIPCAAVAWLGFTEHKDQGFWILLPLASLMTLYFALFFIAGMADITMSVIAFCRTVLAT